MKASDIRKSFVQFFEKYEHQKVESSSLIPHNDPTLLFANAGMNQFKDYFTGRARPKNKRAVSIQKCVRAGGKHNDLEEVGLTARHHTFFEMLGNFSFGGYFKAEAIAFAWEFLTKTLKIPKDKLYITVHYSDDEAIKIWNEQEGVPLDRIFKKGDKDNFWEMGETGPCGPCSEIFYDHGEKHSDPNLKGKNLNQLLDDEMRYVEIWNLVFMQYEQTAQGRIPLPNPCIDTGAGLERIAALMQGKYWNYDSDIFVPIFREIESISGLKYGQTKQITDSMRIVADHIRSSTMLITDGVIPSNEGRGYVLRRIIRRAIRHLRELGIKEVSFFKLVPAVFESLAEEYPQNLANLSLAQKLLQLEEKKFLETLEQGLKFLNENLSEVKDYVFPGELAFKLYDTFGFPLDLTQTILKEKNIRIDSEAFEKSMQKQKEASKKSRKNLSSVDNQIYFNAVEKLGTTKFVGYETLKTKATLLKIIRDEEHTHLIFNETPFYGESGGQAGDQGYIKQNNVILAKIEDCQKPVEGLFVHTVKNTEAFEEGEEYELEVDKKQRELTKRNHSATHLLQSALIQVLGNHVKQAGSSVGPDKLRFDFTHPEALTKDEIEQVEELVNQAINSQLDVTAQVMTKDEALKVGALAFFGDKYGSSVRVITMGKQSVEFCGGTHVSNTGEIEVFIITQETSLSAGVRRIEAITSAKALQFFKNRSKKLKQIELIVNASEKNVVNRVSSLTDDLKSKIKDVASLQEKLQEFESQKLLAQSEKIAGNYNFTFCEVAPGTDLKGLSDKFINKDSSSIVLLYTNTQERYTFLLRRHKSISMLDCGKVLKKSLTSIDGKGGGKPDMAQGSAPNKHNVEKFEIILKSLLQEVL